MSHRLTALVLVLGVALPAAADGIKFGTDYDAGLAQAKKDNKLILWDLRTRRKIKELAGKTGGIRSVAISKDGRSSLSAGHKSAVGYWDLENGELLHEFEFCAGCNLLAGLCARDYLSVVIEQDDVNRWDFSPETPEDRAIKERFAQKTGASGGSSNPAAISHVGHARQLADFVQAIETGRAPLVNGREGRKAVEIILAIYRSAAKGRVVELP